MSLFYLPVAYDGQSKSLLNHEFTLSGEVRLSYRYFSQYSLNVRSRGHHSHGGWTRFRLFRVKKKTNLLLYKEALGMFCKASRPVSAADVLMSCWICLKFGWPASCVSWRTIDSNVVRNAPACRMWSNAYILNDDHDEELSSIYADMYTCLSMIARRPRRRRCTRDNPGREDQSSFARRMRALRCHRW